MSAQHGLALGIIGVAHSFTDRRAEARAYLEQSLAVFALPETPPDDFVPFIADSLGEIYRATIHRAISNGDLQQAKALCPKVADLIMSFKSFEIFNWINDEGFLLLAEGLIAGHEEDWKKAISSFERVLESPYKEHFENGQRFVLGVANENIARYYFLVVHRAHQAVPYFEEALRYLEHRDERYHTLQLLLQEAKSHSATRQDDTSTSGYRVEPLNGALTKAASCYELLEATAPAAERILAEHEEVTPRLFFVTQDGEDGLLTLVSEATGDRGKDELAYKFCRFCALHGVKACALLFTGNLRELPRCEDKGSDGPVEQQVDSATGEGEQDADEHTPAGKQLFPVGTFLGWLCGEFLGEAGRACVWKIEPSVRPVRVEKAWNTEVARGFGRFVNLLGQGRELGYPISDELRDCIAAYLESIRDRDPKSGNILSFGKGKTAGELAVETVNGPAQTRIVEKDGFLYFIGLQSGEPDRRAKKSQLLAALGIDESETPNAGRS